MGNILVRIKYKKLVFKIFSIQFSKKSWWSRWVWQRSINCERDNVSENFLPSIEREVNAFEKMAGWLVIFPLCIQLSDWEDGYRSQVWLVGGGRRPVTHQTTLNCSQQELSQSPCLNLAVRISPTKQTLFKPQTCLLEDWGRGHLHHPSHWDWRELCNYYRDHKQLTAPGLCLESRLHRLVRGVRPGPAIEYVGN